MAEIVAARANTEAEVTVVRSEAKEAVAAAREEDKKTTKDEFATGFFQGYADLKRRVALAHPKFGDVTNFLSRSTQ